MICFTSLINIFISYKSRFNLLRKFSLHIIDLKELFLTINLSRCGSPITQMGLGLLRVNDTVIAVFAVVTLLFHHSNTGFAITGR